MIYRFEAFELDTDQLELRRSGTVQKVEPQVFALLELLISNHTRVVTKDEINQRVWGGRIVSEAAVNSRVRSARRAIDDDGKQQRLIKTVHNRGFRFVGEPTTASTYASPVIDDPLPALEIAAYVKEGRPSIAVLPLQMLSEDLRYGSLADALSHEIIFDLSRLRWLHVIARGSSFRFRGPEVDAGLIGQVLGVRYLLSGSLAIFDQKCTVIVELSQTSDGYVLWADRIESTLDDLQGLRNAITARIATTIESQIQLQETDRAASMPTENLDAWASYHRGLWHMYRFNAHDNQIATAMFDRAIAADPRFARAYAGMSFTHFQNAFLGFTRDDERERQLARQHAETGLGIDPSDPFVNLTMGRSDMLRGDWDSAISWFDKSTQISPNYAFAVYNRGLAEAVIGEGEASEKHAMQAISLSPIDPLHYAMLTTRAVSHLVRGDYEAAAHWAERGARQPTAHVHILVIAALTLELAGNRPAADAWMSKILAANPGFKQAAFFQAFPFLKEETLAIAKASLTRLGI